MSSLSPIPGRVYTAEGSFSMVLAVANVFYAHPFITPRGGFTFDQIGLRVTTAGAGAGADVRLAIYRDRAGRPGELLNDFGSIVGLTSVAGVGITAAGSVVGTQVQRPVLEGGRAYWLASLFNAAATTMPTVAALDAAVISQNLAAALGVVDLGSLPIGVASAAVAVSGALAYGSFPSVAPAVSEVLNGKCPLVGLRAA